VIVKKIQFIYWVFSRFTLGSIAYENKASTTNELVCTGFFTGGICGIITGDA